MSVAPAPVESDDAFPCKLEITIPFPTPRLSTIALRSLSVDKELSPLVHRSFSLISRPSSSSLSSEDEEKSVLRVNYSATTNRMLRVSVNGFFESLRLVVEVMEELDEDVVLDGGQMELGGVQGLGEVAVGV